MRTPPNDANRRAGKLLHKFPAPKPDAAANTNNNNVKAPVAKPAAKQVAPPPAANNNKNNGKKQPKNPPPAAAAVLVAPVAPQPDPPKKTVHSNNWWRHEDGNLDNNSISTTPTDDLYDLTLPRRDRPFFPAAPSARELLAQVPLADIVGWPELNIEPKIKHRKPRNNNNSNNNGIESQGLTSYDSLVHRALLADFRVYVARQALGGVVVAEILNTNSNHNTSDTSTTTVAPFAVMKFATDKQRRKTAWEDICGYPPLLKYLDEVSRGTTLALVAATMRFNRKLHQQEEKKKKQNVKNNKNQDDDEDDESSSSSSDDEEIDKDKANKSILTDEVASRTRFLRAAATVAYNRITQLLRECSPPGGSFRFPIVLRPLTAELLMNRKMTRKKKNNNNKNVNNTVKNSANKKNGSFKKPQAVAATATAAAPASATAAPSKSNNVKNKSSSSSSSSNDPLLACVHTVPRDDIEATVGKSAMENLLLYTISRIVGGRRSHVLEKRRRAGMQ